MTLTVKTLARYCEATDANAAKYVDYLNQHMAEAQIIGHKHRTAGFLAHIGHESASLSSVVEGLSYRADRLMKVWPSRFPTLASAMPYANNPRALANKVYGGRMGNTVTPDDGWLFRGRGLKQLTGRDNYTLLGYADNPDDVALPAGAAYTAVRFWSMIGGNVYADRNDFVGLTKAINGGLNGLEDRQRRYTKILQLL